MVARNPASFTQDYQEAVDAVLNAVATVGEERRQHLRDARLAVGRALHDACNGEQWYLADHLRQSIRDVEITVYTG
jgi:hypothetical protein